MNRPVLGILGGVGPLATAYFMELVIKKTPAGRDQDNIPMIVFNDPQIPDRTSYILGKAGDSPLPEMTKVARWLEDSGADYLAIPCNTAHYFYDGIASSVNIPVVNIMQETSRRISSACGRGSITGLMATRGTIESGVFQNYLEQQGVSAVAPSEEDQRIVDHLIYDCVKANAPYDEAEFLGVAERLMKSGCDSVIVGCTELSVIFQDLAVRPKHLFDSLEVLAERCVELYLWARREGGDIEM